MELLTTAIALAAAGVVVGILSGMLGIGGGTVIVPLLRLAFGFPAIEATATSLFVIIPTSISGATQHIRQKTCIPKLGIALGIGGAVSSSIGVVLAEHSPSWAIMLVAALVIGYSAYSMLKKALKAPSKKSPAQTKAATPPTTVSPDSENFTVTRRTCGIGLCIGLIAGLASGYVGVGGGFIMVPLMVSWLSVPIHKATGTSLLAIIVLSIPSVIEYCMLGHVNYLAGIMLAAGSIPGALLGARLGVRVPERQLRFTFAAFLLIVALSLAVNEFVFAA